MLEFILGIVGVAVGSAGQFLIDHFRYQRETKKQNALDDKRKELLRTSLTNMPKGVEWRKLSTLCGIIGADPQTTTRLLIELGARGSESEEDVWALVTEKPLSQAVT